MWVNLTFVVVLMLAALSQLQGRNDCPFRYPDMYFDYRGCSTVLDWSRAIDGGCQDSYEVQFIDEDCNMRTFNTTEKDLFAGEYPPGRCLADDNCYARVGAQGRENLPTRYSTWTGLSHTSQMFHGTYIY